MDCNNWQKKEEKKTSTHEEPRIKHDTKATEEKKMNLQIYD